MAKERRDVQEAKAQEPGSGRTNGRSDSEHPTRLSRRSFGGAVLVGFGSFFVMLGSWCLAMLRFFFPGVSFEPSPIFKAGYPEDYSLGEVDKRWKDKYRVWVVRTAEGFYALLAVCTHLGCTPNWQGEKFKCPCHGSGFDKEGINREGPAPRPLDRVKITLADDGQILIDKSQLFTYDPIKGINEWNEPGAFLMYGEGSAEDQSETVA